MPGGENPEQADLYHLDLLASNLLPFVTSHQGFPQGSEQNCKSSRGMGHIEKIKVQSEVLRKAGPEVYNVPSCQVVTNLACPARLVG